MELSDANFSSCDKDVRSFQNNVSFHPLSNQPLSWAFLSSFLGMCQIILKFLKNKCWDCQENFENDV